MEKINKFTFGEVYVKTTQWISPHTGLNLV